jgi:hypothetical protein
MAESIGPILGGVGSAAGAGASIYSIVQGKNAQEANQRALDQIFKQQSGLSSDIISQTNPLRQLTAASLFDVLNGGRNANLRVFAPERESLEGQFTQARANIIGNTPNQGGQLNKSLADLDVARAQSVAGLETNVRQRAFEDALRTGFGVAPQSVFPAFSGASNTLAQLSGQGIQQQMAGGQGLGSVAALGTLMSMKPANKSAA